MLFRSPVKRARLLAVMLLAAIAWGSTAELTHHHLAKGKVGGSISTNQFSIPDEATATQISSSETNGTSSKSKSGADCLICQLHQNLSATEISHSPGDGPTEIRGLNTLPDAVVKLSEFTSTGHGRAPPANL